MFCKLLAKRLPHHFQVCAGAMDHHHGRANGVARPHIDHVECRAGNRDHLALRRIGALQGKDTGLRDQRQDRQRRQGNYRYH
jgi:hypothetical protein